MNNIPCLFPSETRPMCLHTHLHKDSLQWLCSCVHIYSNRFVVTYYETVDTDMRTSELFLLYLQPEKCRPIRKCAVLINDLRAIP